MNWYPLDCYQVHDQALIPIKWPIVPKFKLLGNCEINIFYVIWILPQVFQLNTYNIDLFILCFFFGMYWERQSSRRSISRVQEFTYPRRGWHSRGCLLKDAPEQTMAALAWPFQEHKGIWLDLTWQPGEKQ